MTEIRRTPSSPGQRGRPRAQDLTRRLVAAALAELAERGPDGAGLARIAARAGTSQQALARRWGSKDAGLAAALRQALEASTAPAPLRSAGPGATTEALAAFLDATLGPLQATALGRAYAAALAPGHASAALRRAALEHEAGWRLALRQLLIATPFEAEMDIRIDLALGYLRLMAATELPARPDAAPGRRVAELILGLVAPRAPDARARPATPSSPDAPLPGL
ncbi:TetR family transcriptional regulator [Microvirga tunisiensis]|uniref:TetR family transcriptional regulator n=1 Tax=Pannonibacter tanglangensis TaxID=2750084 RepID=A0A7X5J827_9HYPH|nr:TetR family transcriptional regulator [Pannonibacter sp. XCT-53]NBN77427.1 TetR family transcriptional regulator [Pannonibacter sp. XCT-53]